MKSKNNNLLLIGVFAAAGYFLYNRNKGQSLLDVGCAPGAQYYNEKLGLYTNYCPSEYRGQRWFLLSDGLLYPEGVLPQFGYVEVSGYWIHQNQYQSILQQWELYRQQNLQASFSQFMNSVANGITVLASQTPNP